MNRNVSYSSNPKINTMDQTQSNIFYQIDGIVKILSFSFYEPILKKYTSVFGSKKGVQLLKVFSFQNILFNSLIKVYKPQKEMKNKVESQQKLQLRLESTYTKRKVSNSKSIITEKHVNDQMEEQSFLGSSFTSMQIPRSKKKCKKVQKQSQKETKRLREQKRRANHKVFMVSLQQQIQQKTQQIRLKNEMIQNKQFQIKQKSQQLYKLRIKTNQLEKRIDSYICTFCGRKNNVNSFQLQLKQDLNITLPKNQFTLSQQHKQQFCGFKEQQAVESSDVVSQNAKDLDNNDNILNFMDEQQLNPFIRDFDIESFSCSFGTKNIFFLLVIMCFLTIGSIADNPQVFYEPIYPYKLKSELTHLDKHQLQKIQINYSKFATSEDQGPSFFLVVGQKSKNGIKNIIEYLFYFDQFVRNESILRIQNLIRLIQKFSKHWDSLFALKQKLKNCISSKVNYRITQKIENFIQSFVVSPLKNYLKDPNETLKHILMKGMFARLEIGVHYYG